MIYFLSYAQYYKLNFKTTKYKKNKISIWKIVTKIIREEIFFILLNKKEKEKKR